MFVFENVPGLLSLDGGRHWQNVQAMLQAAGYEIQIYNVRSKDFGVPQDRRRIIIIGRLIGTQHQFPVFNAVEPNWTIADILHDLPAIQAGGQSNHYRRVAMHPYVTQHLRTPDDVLTWHIARPNIDRDREIYRIAIRQWMQHGQRLHYQTLPEHLRTHQNLEHFTDRFKL